ncbi:Ku protein [Bosea sp. (in: a-proteobacteria)]|uniref:non-homologous end joining protein Ku n=1 Tax=Bosea sp. (in: a-proteobacteria) TaxID=1871050 RepID=UPI002732C8EB|nr:Ku protein [Bosea sp. (in: a-proteobacteria)]MDP3411526.1 Ku protein [Bosea sp. (in: a-proteobacteria)]
MAPRTFWKGYLKLSLVTCPVAMMPARSESEKVRFHKLNRKTGNRIQSRYVDAVTGKPVADEDEVKGYPKGDDDYIVLEDDELDSVSLESTRTIDIQTFAPRSSVGWVWYDAPHYLVPDSKIGEEAFSVIREAMKRTKTVGISRVVLYRRERAVLLDARDNGIVLWTLRYGDEVRPEKDYFAAIKPSEPDEDLRPLMDKLITTRTKDWSPDLAQDPVQDELLSIIKAKQKGRKPSKPAARQPSDGNVVNIMDALKKSLEPRRT